MLTWPEFEEAAEWVAESWPHTPWTVKEAQTVFGRLNEHIGRSVLMEDVWSFLHHAIEGGDKFPPGPAEMLAGVRDATARRLRARPVEPVLPADLIVGLDARSAFLHSRGFESWDAAVAHFADEYRQQRLSHPDADTRARWETHYGRSK